METVELNFISGDPRKRFEWITFHNAKLVGLCDGQFCFSCNYEERKKLANFSGGKLKAALQPQLKAGPFGVQRNYYLAHLVSVPEVAEVVLKGDDIGIESEPYFNTVLYRIGGETILVDPGSMALDGDEKEFLKLLSGQRLSAVILTHSHRDHWAFLHLLTGVDAPIYLTPFAFRLVEHTAKMAVKMEKDDTLFRILRKTRVINPGDQINVGDTKIYTFPLVHSIPETMGLLLSGKKRAVHLGDFKLGEGVEKAETITALRAIAREKVDLLVATTVNAHLEGYAVSESVVLNSLTDVMIKAEGRVIVTCFSTNVRRIQGVVEVAQAQGRKICFLGTGMKRAQEELLREGEVFLQEDGEVSDPRSVILLSGNQAEEKSILQRVLSGSGESPYQPEKSDTVIFSSRGIPGNEIIIREEIQGLLPRVRMIFLNQGEIENLGLEQSPKVQEVSAHSSGHEYKEGLELTVDVLDPRSVLPIPQSGEGYEAFLKMINGRELVKERIVEL